MASAINHRLSRVPNIEEYLRPDVIRQVSRLDMKAKFIVEGFIAGLHASPFLGFSTEFSEHRRYVKGDDIKDIDWNVYAKTDKYYIKKFEAETNMACYLLVDMSASMAYTYRGEMTKLEYATCLAAALGYMMINQQDAVGLVTFDDEVRSYLPPKSKRSQLVAIISELSKARAGKRTDVPACLHTGAELLRDRGLVIVFSDLYADVPDLLHALHHIRYRGHDVIVFHVLDEAEAKFDFDGPLRFRDVETGERIVADAKGIREDYLRQVRAFTDELADECRKANIDYVLVDTAQPFDKALLSFLLNRRSHF